MKATLTFTLPREKDEFEQAQKGTTYLCALDEIRNLLRNEVKYDGKKTVDELYTEVCEILSEAGVP
jgi:hypothetical protein